MLFFRSHGKLIKYPQRNAYREMLLQRDVTAAYHKLSENLTSSKYIPVRNTLEKTNILKIYKRKPSRSKNR